MGGWLEELICLVTNALFLSLAVLIFDRVRLVDVVIQNALGGLTDDAHLAKKLQLVQL